MKAAWYEKQGPARDVLVLGEMDTPMPGDGEVRIRIEASGINPGDVRKRLDAFGVGMPFPRIVPHSDGAGTVDAVGAGVPDSWIGQRVWCYGAQTYRAFGTAAEYTVVPLRQAIRLPAAASMDQGACLGIPGITAYRAVQVAGDLVGKTVPVQGGAGAVGACAVQLAHRAGARVIATCRGLLPAWRFKRPAWGASIVLKNAAELQATQAPSQAPLARTATIERSRSAQNLGATQIVAARLSQHKGLAQLQTTCTIQQ